VRGSYTLASNKLWRMSRATPDLLRKAPDKLTGVNGTGAYSMEARPLRCEHRFRYVARGVSLVVAFLLCLGVFLLPLPATGSEVPSALAMANLPGLDLETNGNGHPLDGTYVVAPGLVLRGAKERLAPILMTAGATGLALVPLAVAGSIAGNEIEHPMAIVILGGLVTSTLLNLFVLPSLYLRFGRSDRSVKGEPAG
jgi:hypothetical protein